MALVNVVSGRQIDKTIYRLFVGFIEKKENWNTRGLVFENYNKFMKVAGTKCVIKSPRDLPLGKKQNFWWNFAI